MSQPTYGPLPDAELRRRLRRSAAWLQARHIETLQELQHIERERSRVGELLWAMSEGSGLP